MANNVHIKIDGIEGESADAKHIKTIDVLAWSWGMSQSGTFHTGSGGGQGKASVQDLSFTKHVDAASTKLQHACVDGDHIEKAVGAYDHESRRQSTAGFSHHYPRKGIGLVGLHRRLGRRGKLHGKCLAELRQVQDRILHAGCQGRG